VTTNKTALILERDGPVAIIINNDAPINRMTLEFINQLEGMMSFLEKRKPDFSTDPD